MTTTTVRLAYEDPDAAETMRHDAEAVGDRLGVGRAARLDRAASVTSTRRERHLGPPQASPGRAGPPPAGG